MKYPTTVSRKLWQPLLVVLTVLLLWVGMALQARADAGTPTGWDVEMANQRMQIGSMVLKYEPDLEDDARALAAAIPSYWSRIEQELSGDLDDRMTIILVNHSGRIADATGVHRWAAGVAHSPTGRIMISRHSPDGSRTELGNLLKHEMVHVALYRSVGNRPLPRWFHEGVAESFTNNIDFARSRTLAGAVFGPGVPRLERIEKDFYENDATTASVAYAASRDLVSYLRARDDRGSDFRQFLHEISEGHGFEAAFIRSFGLSLGELDAEWRAGLSGRFAWFPIIGNEGLPLALVSPLMVVALLRRKRRFREGLERLDREEKAARKGRFGRFHGGYANHAGA
ncbi:MAG: peptidase MA family metallohydrolase [Nannocystaceae bacterium]